METEDGLVEHLETVRQPWTLVIVYTVFYAAVFLAGLVGNVFVVLAIVFNTNLRSVTDYLISSLALADLLIILFCLPTTLLNNLLTEWQLGAIGCKLSTFINSTTSCASIFTLVAVTADRYLAICHTLKYTFWEARSVIYTIFVIWFVSALLASPNLIIYDEILYDLLPPNGTLVARLCVSTQEDFLHFIIVNLIIAFLLPVILICVSYALIFITVSNRQSLAVDARVRDERVKLRVAQMMLTVIIVFMLCWTPLYGLYCYFFLAESRESGFFQFATSVLRPIFQWLSLLSSSLNPLIYIAYSQKYRRAFHQLLLMPCRLRYQSLRRATRATLRLPPLKADEELRNGSFYYANHATANATLNNNSLTENWPGSSEFCALCSPSGAGKLGMGSGPGRRVSLQHQLYYSCGGQNGGAFQQRSGNCGGGNHYYPNCNHHHHNHAVTVRNHPKNGRLLRKLSEQTMMLTTTVRNEGAAATTGVHQSKISTTPRRSLNVLSLLHVSADTATGSSFTGNNSNNKNSNNYLLNIPQHHRHQQDQKYHSNTGNVDGNRRDGGSEKDTRADSELSKSDDSTESESMKMKVNHEVVPCQNSAVVSEENEEDYEDEEEEEEECFIRVSPVVARI